MEIVVDTSVIIAVIANEPEKDILIRQTKGADIIAPLSVHWEIGNAFSAMLKQKRITIELALKCVDIYRKIPLRLVEVGLEESLRIADRLNIYAYDAYIISCALQYHCSIISLDRRLTASAKSMNIEVMEVK